MQVNAGIHTSKTRSVKGVADDGSNAERNEVLYESSISQSRLVNVYNRTSVVEPNQNMPAHEASICNKDTSSLESILEDIHLPS